MVDTPEPTRPEARKRSLLLILIGVCFTIATACGIFYWSFAGPWANSPPEEPAQHRTELLLEAVKNHPGEPMPDDLPVDIQFGAEQCWDLLQETMAANNNQYMLEVIGIWGDYGTPVCCTGSTEVVIEIVFPDGTRVETYYYAYNLDVCRELDNDL